MRVLIFLKYLIGNLLYFFSYVIRKKSNYWVFGSWGGNLYADNPKYLFKYVVENHPDIRAIWITRNRKVLKQLRDKNYECYAVNTPKGIWFSSIAKVGVISHGMVDINRYACAKMKIVQTWHGVPMKPVLKSDPKPAAIKRNKQLEKISIIFPFLKKEINHKNNLIVCSSSDLVSLIFKQIFGHDAPVKNIGFPRLDGIFRPDQSVSLFQEINSKLKMFDKVGVYIPTYRRKMEYDIIDLFLKNAELIENSLNAHNTFLFIKIHPYEFYKIPNSFKSSSFAFIDNNEIDNDIYTVLGLFDFLISDYSSIIFDYIIQNKPVYLLCPDREKYVESNGDFIFDYDQLNFPVYQSWDKLIKDINSESLNKITTQSNIESNRFHIYKDGDSSKRLFEHICLKLDISSSI